MKATLVSLIQTDAAAQAGRPALTPELLAASGARYSRSNEGLQHILSRIDPLNLDSSVDSIFRMIDYGHQSIADMVPVAIFIDNISMWLAYYIWTLCPTAGGQESSTRYIRLSVANVTHPTDAGLPSHLITEWNEAIQQAFAAYHEALQFWEDIVHKNPALARIPAHILEDKSDRGNKILKRMVRNFGFDRARVFIPAATSTNLMLIMSARGWIQLCQVLLSHPLPEALSLGRHIVAELTLVTPRLIKHAERKESIAKGIALEFQDLVSNAAGALSPYLESNYTTSVLPPTPFLEVQIPPGLRQDDIVSSLQFHDNRYAWTGEALKRSITRFGWDAVGFAEIRDLNRHRTGTKSCPLNPLGFYDARDQLPDHLGDSRYTFERLNKTGRSISRRAAELLSAGDPTFVYWILLGTQFKFEHVTTADKFVYEAELRTGTGAHFRYARHFHDVLEQWYNRFPDTRGIIIEGAAEPE